MPEHKNTVRVQRRARRLIDEQFWPVVLAIAALGAMLASLASAYLRTDDARWYANSWNWFGAIVAASVLSLGLLKLQTRRFRPGIQLSVVLCALIHLLLLVAALETRIFDHWWDEQSIAQPEETPILVAPDYQTEPADSEDSELAQLEQHLEVETPNPLPADLTQESIEVPIEPPPQTLTEQESAIVPSLLDHREATSALPQQGDEPYRLRRAETRVDSQPAPEVALARQLPLTQSRQQVAPSPTDPARRENADGPELSRRAADAPDRQLVVAPRPGALVSRDDLPELQEAGPSRWLGRRATPSAIPVEVTASTGQASPTSASAAPSTALNSAFHGPAKSQLESTEGVAPRAISAPAAAGGPDVAHRSPPRRTSSLSTDFPAGGVASGGPTRRRPLPGQLRLETQVPIGTGSAGSPGDDERGEVGNAPGATGELAESTATAPAKQTTDLGRVPTAEGRDQQPPILALNPGVRTRRSVPESDSLLPPTVRFRRRDFSGSRPTNRNAIVVPTQPFRQRASRLTEGAPRRGNLGPETEEAIERGLAYLAKQQLPDGRWRLGSDDEPVALSSDTAATGLALLAFQGAGYNHLQHKYADVVRRGIEFLTENQQPNGDLFVPLDDDSNRSVWLYSHAIACLALTEAYGMTQDPSLRSAAQRSVDFIVAAQDQTNGGWRYVPGVSSDSSVSGWMLMALKSGQLARLEVPELCWSLARRWFDLAQASEGESHLYRYNPYAPDTASQRHGRVPSQTMTAVGLLMRLYDGWHREDAAMVRGGEYLQKYLPAAGSPSDPKRDTYYWYYGTQVMFHMQGEYWNQWRQALQPLLIERQIMQGSLAGSWEPRGPVPDRWANHAGRLYVTTLNLLSLEVRYRHLPIYEETAR